MTTNTIKTRFAPSPTGFMHLGNTRTALFSALLARHAKGIFLLRIEDTDKERSDEHYTEILLDDLLWLGLDWQEGPGHDLGHGPYWQAQRQSIYDEFYQRLQDKGQVYPCFCTEQQLALARKVQRAAGKPPRYPGTCRAFNPTQIEEKLAQGLQPALRFSVPANQEIVFQDLVRGEQRFNSNDLGDFIIRRQDGTPPFLFCNAVDDSLMGVTVTLRGEDHLANTPRQIMVLQALNLTVPRYGHIPLIVGADGSPLSKRHGSRSVQELRKEGFLALGLVNYLARLGHYYPEDVFMSLDELAAKFSLAGIGRSPARFDATQLLRWQKEAVVRLDEKQLWDWLGEEIQQSIPVESRSLFLDTIRANVTFPNDAAQWAKVFFTDNLEMGAEQQTIIAAAGKNFFQVALSALQAEGPDFYAISAILKKELDVKGKALFQPLRVALTGELHGPEMIKIFELLGEDKIRERLQRSEHATNL